MCQICVDWEKGKLSISEAWRNLLETKEFINSEEDLDHYLEVADKLMEEEYDGG